MQTQNQSAHKWADCKNTCKLEIKMAIYRNITAATLIEPHVLVHDHCIKTLYKECGILLKG